MPEGRAETPDERYQRKLAEAQKNVDNAKRQHAAWVASGRQYKAFNAYAEYRQPLDEYEQRQLEGAIEDEKKQQDANPLPEERHWSDGHVGGFIDDEFRLALHASMTVHMQLAMGRAGAQLDLDERGDKYPEYPEEPGLLEKYPGIDPLGKCTEAEMSLAYRIEQVRAALAVRPPEVQAYVRGVLEDMTPRRGNDTPIGRTVSEMSAKCSTIRHFNRAAKVSPDRITSEHLEEEAFTRERNCEPLKWMDRAVQTLESLTGLNDRPITDQQRRELAEEGRAIPEGLDALRDAPNVQPAGLTVNFPDFEHERQYRFFSTPQNWGKSVREMMRHDFAPGHEQAVDGIIGRYASATASRTLDGCFRQIEELSLDRSKPGAAPMMNRGDLVTVDGMTLREHMERQYLAEHRTLKDFGNYYAANFKQRSAEILSAGLMAGKRVEAFVPDKLGRIPNEPVQVTKAGYEPSPLKKVTLNAWERYFAKRGFYKEKLARAEEYRRITESRERVKAINAKQRGELQSTVSDYLRNQIFGGRQKTDQAMKDHNTQYSWTRGFPTTLAVSVMLAQGHSFEDIMDPDKLREAKESVGKEVIERTRADDHAWIGGKLHDGYMALIGETDRLFGTFNVSDPRQMQEHYAEVESRSGLLFDLYQETTRPGALEGFLARAEEVAPGSSSQREFEMEERTRALGNLRKGMEQVMNGKVFYSNPNRAREAELDIASLQGSEMSNYFSGLTATQRFARAMKKGAPASLALGGLDSAGMILAAGMVDEVSKIMDPVHDLKDGAQRGKLYEAVQYLAAHDRLGQALPTAMKRQEQMIPLDSYTLGADGKAVKTPRMTSVGLYEMKADREKFIQALQAGAKKLETARALEAKQRENTAQAEARPEKAAAGHQQEAAKPKPAAKAKPAAAPSVRTK